MPLRKPSASTQNSAEAYCWRGIAYSNLGAYDKAVTDHSTALRLDPKFLQASYNRGQAYFQQGHLDRAISDFTQVIRHDPAVTQAYIARIVRDFNAKKRAQMKAAAATQAKTPGSTKSQKKVSPAQAPEAGLSKPAKPA